MPCPARIDSRRLITLAVIGGSIGLGLLAATVGPAWFREQPREQKQRVVEGLIQGMFLVHDLLILAALAALPLLLGLLKARQLKRRPRSLEVGVLACFSCLVSLAGLELTAAAWRGWTHRLPALPTHFEPSSPGALRIVVLGGSSALGEPYRPWVSVGQIVARRLQDALPDRQVSCQILAWLGEDLEAQQKRLATITDRPDILIVYSGHNEFAARFEEERQAWLDRVADSVAGRLTQRIRLASPFCRLVEELASKSRLDLPPLSGRHRLIDPPQASESETADIVADFTRRLDAIAGYCDNLGAVAILIVPPANEADYEPSRSTVRPATSALERERLTGDFTRARSLESLDPAASRRLYEAILKRHPEFAEAHYRLGKLLLAAGDREGAASEFLLALDHDGLPIRCPEPIRAAYGIVGARHPRAVVIDGRSELMAASPGGLLGDDVIQDTHHPTLRGQARLAQAVLTALRNRLPLPADFDPHVSAPDCVRLFQLDAERLAIACLRTSEHYHRVAGYRYDGSERQRKSDLYAEAAARLRQGIEPDALGLPGMLLHDPPGRNPSR